MRALLSIVAIAAVAAAAPGRSEPRCNSLETSCADLYLAIECGTVESCIPRWEKLTTKVGNDTELCAVCKDMVREARDNLLSNMTQTELRQVLEGSCDDLIPIRPFNGICKKLMDTFQDELNDLLVSRMDPTQVCTVSGLCYTSTDNSDIAQRASDIFLRKSALKTCNTCKSSVGKIVRITELAEKSDVVKAFSVACQRAGYPKTKCDEFAQTYVAKFLHHFQTASSEKTCQFFGRCDGASRPMTVGPADTLECEFCEAMIHKVVVQFNNTSMKEQVKTVLENICKKSGSWAAECQQRIEDDFDKAYDELISMLDPVNVCSLAGICNSKQSLRTLPMAKLTPARPAAPGSTKMCTICRDVAQVVEKAVNANFTQNQLINALDLVCHVLPVTSKGSCFDFVNKNVPQLIQMFNDRFTVDHICSESFKFCPAAPALTPAAHVSDPVCDECQQVANYVVTALNDDRTEQNIKTVLDKACQNVPVDYGRCKQFVETNIDQLYQILRKEVTADEICKTLRLCATRVPTPPKTLKKVGHCGLCSTVVDYLIEKLKVNSSNAAILDTLEKVCKVLPVDRKECQNYIDVYGEYIISMIEQNFAADAICAAIGLCETPRPVIRNPKTVCDECQKIASVIVNAINDDRSEENIKAVLEKTCELCPDVDGCQQWIDTNLDQLYQMLREKVTVDNICKTLRLCGRRALLVPVPIVRAPETPACDECRMIAGIIVDALNDDHSEANIKAVLEKTCQWCPDVDGCRKFMDANIDQLYQILREEVTVDNICNTLKLCGVRARPGTTPVKPKTNLKSCGVCSDIVNFLIGELKDNTTDAAVLDAVSRVCKVLPFDRAECQNVVNVYGEYIITMIQQDVAADQICRAIGLCRNARPVVREPKTVCDECQKIAGVIVSHLDNDRSEAKIKAVLEDTCKWCPDADGCRKFIDANIDQLYQILKEEVTVDSICKTLRLCGIRAHPIPVVRAPKTVCDECQKIAGVIVSHLDDDRSEAKIKAVLENTCQWCPDAAGCRKFIDANIDQLYQILREEVTVDSICKTLKLCGIRALPAPLVRAPKTVCDECQMIAGIIVDALDDDRSEAKIKAVLENTCQWCPDAAGCRKFMDANIDQLYQILKEEVTVDNICQTLRLCGIRALPAPVVRAPKTVCDECQKIAGVIVDHLNSDRSEAKIKEVLENTCQWCPDADGCRKFIDANIDQLYQILREEVTVDSICKTLKLCGIRALPAPAPASQSCELCQAISAFVITELKDNKTDAAIVAALEKGCTALPIDQTQCRNIIDTYSSMIVSMIQNDLTPDEICGTLQLCRVPKPKGQSCELCETVAHFLLDELKDNKTDAAILDVLERVCNVLPVDKVSCRNVIDTYGGMIMSLIQQDASADEICAAIGLCSTRKIVPRVKSDFCNACRAISGFLIDELKDNQTDKAVVAALEKVCKVVPVDKVQCQNYVDVYGSMVIEMIKNNLSADEICSSTGFCSGRIQFSDNQVCPLCQIVVHVVEAELKNNNTQEEIQDALQKACSLMPKNDQQQCRNMINVYTAYIIDMVESLATAEQICQTLGLCPTPPTPPKCEVCMFITNFVESELSDNRTESEILKLLDKACEVIPNMDVPQCKNTINQFSDMIITLLLQSVPPRKICEEIKVCPLSKKSESVSAVRRPFIADEKCALCKWLVTWVDDKLQDNRTEAVIIDELDKACDLLSDAGKCKDMVNDYVDMIVKMLIQYADPETICEAIKKCPAKQFKKDEPPCRYCRYVIDELRSDVKQTEAELKKKLDGICRVIPVDPSSCQAFVEQHADQIIHLILMDADPEKICEMLGVCPRKIKATETKCNFCREVMQFVTNEVRDEATDDEIVAAVARACNYVPPIHREGCQRMVEIEGLVIVRLIGESLDADSICEAIKSCPEKRNADKLTCTWCQYALHFIQEKLYDNSTQQAIQNELEKMCAELPKPEISAECKEFVDTYGPSLEVIIAQDLDPSVICPAIHACPVQKTLGSPLRLRSTQRCHDCVSTLRSFRHNPSQVCRSVAPQFATRCAGASEIGVQIVNAFESDYKICKYAKSCSNFSGSFKCNRGGCQHVH